MKYRAASIHPKRIKDIQELFPIQLAQDDLNWIVDWILSIGLKSIYISLQFFPELTLQELFIKTTKLHPKDAPETT